MLRDKPTTNLEDVGGWSQSISTSVNSDIVAAPAPTKWDLTEAKNMGTKHCDSSTVGQLHICLQ